MSNHAFLESFDHDRKRTTKESHAADKWQDSLRSEAFEAGYTSGWEDAMKSDKTSRLNLEAELERNVQNLVFTFGEAVTQVRSELGQLLDALFDQLLPSITFHLVREHTKSCLSRIADDLTDQTILITASPKYADELTVILQHIFPEQVKIVEDSKLSEAQIFIRIDSCETSIDLKPLIESIISQLNAIRREDTVLGELSGS